MTEIVFGCAAVAGAIGLFACGLYAFRLRRIFDR
jgi:hypothetical protein